MQHHDATRGRAGRQGLRPGIGLAEDLDLQLRLGERGKLVNLPQTLQKYRWHDQSISAKKQAWYPDRLKLVVLRACERRGIERRDVSIAPWRPTNRHARFEYAMRIGWTGYMRGDREMAQAYAAKALRLIPWRSDGWRLLACAVLKLGRRESSHPRDPGVTDLLRQSRTSVAESYG